MKLQLLGTGSPNPLSERQGAAVLLSRGSEHLLFDAGRGVTTQLVRAGVAPHQLTAIFLTHHHYDHIGNLGDLLLTAWHGGASRLPVIGPPGTEHIVQALFEQVYQREILFSLALAQATADPMQHIREVIPVIPISAAQLYQQGDWRIQAAAVDHGHQLGFTQTEWPCFGYRIEVDGKSIVISGDTIACESLIVLARDADVLVQCCYLPDAMLNTPTHQLLSKLVIATSGQVGKIATQAGVKTLVLTHFSDISPDMLAAIERDVRRDFAGPLYLGEDLMTLEL
jgi:ribonuclease BN (tRNA processing enzyme)